jgi:hypothetical protein
VGAVSSTSLTEFDTTELDWYNSTVSDEGS